MMANLRVFLVSLLAAVGTAQSGPPAAPTPDPDPPKTLEQALHRLESTLPETLLAEMRDGPEEAMARHHFSVGLSMRNTWGLWSGGPLHDHLAALGLKHPDDMSGVILTSLWRRLNDKPLRVAEQVAEYQEYWRLAVGPKPDSNPSCPGPIDTTLSLGPMDIDKSLAGVHMGACCATGDVWSYHADRGWYSSTEAELLIWNRDPDGRYDPCSNDTAGERGDAAVGPWEEGTR